MNVTDVSA